MLVTVLVWAVVMAIPAATIGGGSWLLHQRTAGTRVRATVLECGLSGGVFAGTASYGQDCTASWVIDGETVIGGFNGGNGDSDVGTTVDATVRGNVAYSRSLKLPVILIALGLPFLLLPLNALRSRARRRRTT